MSKAVIFDLNGVAMNPVGGLLNNYLSKKLGVSPETIRKSLDARIERYQKGEEGSIIWSEISEELGIEIDAKSIWKEAVSATFNMRPEILRLAGRIKDLGYFVGILSNTEKEGRDYFIRKGYGKYFNPIIFSCDIGSRKPEIEAYSKLIDILDINPKKIIFIDDKKENVNSAISLGIKGKLFESYDSLIQDLKLEGVNV